MQGYCKDIIMNTNKTRFTFGTFFLLLLTVNIVGAVIFYWMGLPTDEVVGAVSHTQVIVMASIALISFVAIACLGTAVYFARPQVEWNF